MQFELFQFKRFTKDVSNATLELIQFVAESDRLIV